jgi:hypothetical protein
VPDALANSVCEKFCKIVTRQGGWHASNDADQNMVDGTYTDQMSDALSGHHVAGSTGAQIDFAAMAAARLLMLQAAPLQAYDPPFPVHAAAIVMGPGASLDDLGAELPVVVVQHCTSCRTSQRSSMMPAPHLLPGRWCLWAHCLTAGAGSA